MESACVEEEKRGLVFVSQLRREQSKHDPTLPLPDEITANGAKYPVVGLIVDGEITFVVPEKVESPGFDSKVDGVRERSRD